jgi:hypothetical protein
MISKYIWESAVPDKLKSRKIKSSLEPTKTSEAPQDCNTSTSLLMQAQDSIYKEMDQSAPLYSIKYLGITKGQIGILSKRTPIPYLSPLEACKDVPLTLINSSLSDRKISSRMINRLINVPNPAPLNLDFSVDKPEKKTEEENFPDPEIYNEKIIHTYARPKALVSVKKEFGEGEGSQRKPVVTPYNRVGISGWKLSRPKTAMRSEASARPLKTRSLTRRTKLEKTKPDLTDYFNEPYLKFLAEKRKSNNQIL